MKERGFINYLVAIGVVLGVAFLSQQPFFRGKTSIFFYNYLPESVKKELSNAAQWAKDNSLGRLSGEVQSRGETIKSQLKGQLEQEKQNVFKKVSENKIFETVGEKIKNYFSGVVDGLMGKNNPQNCSQ